MSRAGISQLTKAMTMIKSTSEAWKMVTSAMSRNRTGIESNTSTIRIMKASRGPPKKPAVAP